MARRSVSNFFNSLQCVDIKADNVKNLFAPIYKGLSIEKFLEEAYKHEIVMSHLPDKQDLNRLPR